MSTKAKFIVITCAALLLVAVMTGTYLHYSKKHDEEKVAKALDAYTTDLKAKYATCDKRSDTLYVCKQESRRIAGLSRTIRIRRTDDTLQHDIKVAVRRFENQEAD